MKDLLGFEEPRDEQQARRQTMVYLALLFVVGALIGLEVGSWIWP